MGGGCVFCVGGRGVIGVFVGPCWALIVAMGESSSYSASKMQKFTMLMKERFIENQGKMAFRKENGSREEVMRSSIQSACGKQSGEAAADRVADGDLMNYGNGSVLDSIERTAELASKCLVTLK